MIQALLKDLGNRKNAAEQSQVVDIWLQRVKDVAYAAENLMDDYEYEMLRRKLEFMKINPLNRRPSFKKKCRNHLSPSTNPLVFRFRMTRRVKKILSDLDDLEETKSLGIKPAEIATKAVSSAASTSAAAINEDDKLHQRREFADAPASDFVGREADQRELLDLLCKPSANQVDLPIIAIVGIGGLGKTTLARRIFYHKEVDEHFGKKKIWICVSEVFNVKRLLKEMLESVSSTKYDLSNIGAITSKLKEELKGDKCLLILDDVWEKDQGLWDSLRNALQQGCEPSKIVILITTRSNEVAEKAQAVYKCKLKGLSKDDGWALLLRKTGLNTGRTCPKISEFENVGRSIVEKCKYVPLAIKAMGGLLKSKETPLEWKSILKSELWKLRLEDEEYIFPSLLLSYNHLPSVAVKQCFIYCALFPKDTLLKKHVLIALWMAEGFLDESKMENDGEDHFSVLLNNSFLDEEEDNYVDEIKRYKMHDLVHDLAASVSKKDLLVWKPDSKLEDVSDVRHLVINFQEEKMLPETPTIMAKLSSLKTISYWGGVPKWDLIMGAQYLRVLIVAKIELSRVPPVIGQLTHLRLLDLSDNEINALPESICKLYQLQTLRLEDNDGLEELPRELYKLESLRHICITSNDLLVPRGLGLLTNLQTLPALTLCDKDEGWTIDELEALDQIKGELNISGLEHVKNKEEARKASLGRKDGIFKLILEWSRSSRDDDKQEDNYVNIIDEDVLGSLEPHSNIKMLRVEGFRGKRFPGWIKTMAVKHTFPLSHLIQVELIDCWRCEQVPTLGQLPNLKFLGLLGFKKVESIGNEFYESSNNVTPNTTNVKLQQGIAKEDQVLLFGALRQLSIWNFESLVTWMPAVAGASVFPCLESVLIIGCPKLERVPALHSQSLERLLIRDCPALVGIPTSSIEKCTSLDYLVIRGCPSIEGPVPDLSKLERLEHLNLVNSGELMRSAGRSIPHLHLLRRLAIGGFRDEEEFNSFVSQMMTSTTHIQTDDASQSLSLLREVELRECPNVKKLPQQLQHLCPSSTLQELSIGEFGELEELPEWIGNLSSLQRLELYGCPKLKSNPYLQNRRCSASPS